MNEIRFPPILVRETADVLVAGGGPAGFAAAVAAARSGADVLLVEVGSCFGGIGTAAGINIFCSMTDGVRDLTGGVCAEFVRSVCGAGFGPPGYDPDRDFLTRRFHYQIEGAKLVYDRMAKAAGFRFLFGTRVVAVRREGDRVSHVVCAAKSGLFAASARVFVDATGDADIAAFAGAETRMGDADGRCQAATLPSVWSGVDRAAAEAAGTSLWGQGGARPAGRAFCILCLFSGNCVLCDLSKILESLGVVDCKVSKHLSVDVDVCKLQAVHHNAVGKAVHSGCRVDTGDPELSELAFLLLASCISTGKCSHD